MIKKVGIQGGKASFHEQAAEQILAKDQYYLVECKTFAALAQKLADGEIDFAVMAIENTIAGNLLPNYSLIQRFNFHIVAETVLEINLHLMAIEAQKIEDLSVIRSHSVALLQCHEFLAKYPNVRTENSYDTADGARLAAENNERNVGIIANKLAAKRYEMEILAENIQTAGNNQTRFLLLSKDEKPYGEKANKSSLCFQLHHHVGSLADILTIFRAHELNLTKILSLPIVGKTEEYNFYIDLKWNKRSMFESALTAVSPLLKDLQVFGMYESAGFNP